MRVNIVLPEDLLKQMDKVAADEGINRSQLIRNAVAAYFSQLSAQNQERQRQEEIQHAIDLQDSLRQSVKSWDAMKDLRKQRQIS